MCDLRFKHVWIPKVIAHSREFRIAVIAPGSWLWYYLKRAGLHISTLRFVCRTSASTVWNGRFIAQHPLNCEVNNLWRRCFKETLVTTSTTPWRCLATCWFQVACNIGVFWVFTLHLDFERFVKIWIYWISVFGKGSGMLRVCSTKFLFGCTCFERQPHKSLSCICKTWVDYCLSIWSKFWSRRYSTNNPPFKVTEERKSPYLQGNPGWGHLSNEKNKLFRVYRALYYPVI